MQCPPELIAAYAEMSEHTKNECAHGCRAPHSCCSPEYGDMAAIVMKLYEAPIPVSTGHLICRFMGPTGCIVEPYLRPICTLHVCCINSLGFKPNDPAWTERYFEIRARIDALESELPTPDWVLPE